jgi:membrane-bound lytic murein transglycosylase F
MGRFLGFTVFMICLAALNGCDGSFEFIQSTQRAWPTKQILTVIAVKHPLIHDQNSSSSSLGYEHDLLERFAKDQGLKVKFVTYPTTKQARNAFELGQGDLLSARLWSQSKIIGATPGPAIDESRAVLFCRKKYSLQKPTAFNQFKILISDRESVLFLSQRLGQLFPKAKVIQTQNQSYKQLFQSLVLNRADCVLAEKAIGQMLLKEFSQIQITDHEAQKKPISWFVRQNETDLQTQLSSWIQRVQRHHYLFQTHEFYLNPTIALDANDLSKFLRSIVSVLPKYSREFKDAAKVHQIDWQLLAALAYQESHWEHDAQSYTGVRGLMQLTHETAKYAGVQDRLDPVQSIWGGAFYLQYLKKQIPAHINKKERLALMLAAYNSGLGHLKDVQELARARGLNPYSWRHLKSLYPLLENPTFAAQLKYGAARGRETVMHVDRTLAFYNVLLAGSSQM